MRHGSSGRRQRNRGNGGRRGNQQRMQVFDSNGPEVRIRGTAHQVTEKYIVLAKDAASSGDRILAESYLQHAEHYQRIINSWDQDVQAPSRTRRNGAGDVQPESGQGETEGDLSLPGSVLGDVSDSVSQEKMAEAAA